MVATGTASGKSLCYQVPIAEAVTDPIRPGTALVLFPTKALAQDQLGVRPPVGARPRRRHLRRRLRPGPAHVGAPHANVVLTNPEMLHGGLLPNHGWATFLMRLRYVVVDELHVLRGVFGTHVAHLLRRLRRLCEHYGSRPRSSSRRPPSASRRAWRRPVRHAGRRGHRRRLARGRAPRRPVDPTASTAPRRPRSANQVTAGAGRRTSSAAATAPSPSAAAARAPSSWRPRSCAATPDLAGRVRPYRGGYLAAERREIEAELFSGQLGAVVATTALELGVDIGGLDACVLNGFPGTIASMWQQVGRAGREGQQSLAVLVAGDDQLDQ